MHFLKISLFYWNNSSMARILRYRQSKRFLTWSNRGSTWRRILRFTEILSDDFCQLVASSLLAVYTDRLDFEIKERARTSFAEKVEFLWSFDKNQMKIVNDEAQIFVMWKFKKKISIRINKFPEISHRTKKNQRQKEISGFLNVLWIFFGMFFQACA